MSESGDASSAHVGHESDNDAKAHLSFEVHERAHDQYHHHGQQSGGDGDGVLHDGGEEGLGSDVIDAACQEVARILGPLVAAVAEDHLVARNGLFLETAQLAQTPPVAW